MVVTRRGAVGVCKCNVGKCRVCGSSCRRCKCACDGISPREALERGRGRQKGYSKAKRLKQQDLLIDKDHVRRSKRRKVIMDDDDSTWLPTVVKKKVAPKKQLKTFNNLNICVEIPLETKQGKLLNTILKQKEKMNSTNKSTTGATTVAEDESKEGNIVEAVPVADGEQLGDENNSNHVPIDEIYIDDDDNLSALDSKVLNLPRQYRPIRLANDPVIKKNYKDYTSSEADKDDDSEVTLSISNKSIQSTTPKEQNQLHEMIKLFNLPKNYSYNLPSKKLRNRSDAIKDEQPERFKRMVTFTMKTFQSVLDVICPGPSQSDVISSCVATMNRNFNGFQQMKKSYNKIGESLSLCLKSSKHSSVERRVIRALLYKNFTANQINELMKTYEFKMATGRTRINAKSDYETLLNDGKLASRSHKFSKLNENDIKYAVNYILDEANVIPLAHGHKTVYIGNGNQVILPKLQRKRVREEIISDYKQLCITKLKKPISRPQMYKIINCHLN